MSQTRRTNGFHLTSACSLSADRDDVGSRTIPWRALVLTALDLCLCLLRPLTANQLRFGFDVTRNKAFVWGLTPHDGHRKQSGKLLLFSWEKGWNTHMHSGKGDGTLLLRVKSTSCTKIRHLGTLFRPCEKTLLGFKLTSSSAWSGKRATSNTFIMDSDSNSDSDSESEPVLYLQMWVSNFYIWACSIKTLCFVYSVNVDKKQVYYLGDLFHEGDASQSFGMESLTVFTTLEWKSLGQLMEEEG